MNKRFTINPVGDFFEVFDWDKKETVYVTEKGREDAERARDRLIIDGEILDDPYGASLLTEG